MDLEEAEQIRFIYKQIKIYTLTNAPAVNIRILFPQLQTSDICISTPAAPESNRIDPPRQKPSHKGKERLTDSTPSHGDDNNAGEGPSIVTPAAVAGDSSRSDSASSSSSNPRFYAILFYRGTWKKALGRYLKRPSTLLLSEQLRETRVEALGDLLQLMEEQVHNHLRLGHSVEVVEDGKVRTPELPRSTLWQSLTSRRLKR
ncbi:hypothetical protein NA57DRAFT_56017 [Rhizodiscina lignyota]|uniref:Uncharacterized protein n=1 Tax=Rhizodiscina lignyota TaxID=1504668 RepID=A0A9P4MBV5_9PEZI|nr:hypothetical protein NA57DRAFT_56017 [Rhizodiscina lignyota]